MQKWQRSCLRSQSSTQYCSADSTHDHEHAQHGKHDICDEQPTNKSHVAVVTPRHGSYSEKP
jgi:hypothetical protein